MLSIIIPFKNNIDLLLSTLNSLLSSRNDEVEIIIVLNNSSYKIEDIKIKTKKIPIKIIVLEAENGGANMARYLGVKNSNNKYILFSDSDDIYLKGSLEFLINKMSKYKNYDIIQAGIEIQRGEKIKKMLNLNSKIEIIDFKSLSKNIKYVTPNFYAKVFKKEILMNENIWLDLKICQDWNSVIKSFLISKKIVLLPKIVYRHIKHKNSITTSKQSDSYIVDETIKSLSDIYSFSNGSNNGYKRYKIIILCSISDRMISNLYNICRLKSIQLNKSKLEGLWSAKPIRFSKHYFYIIISKLIHEN